MPSRYPAEVRRQVVDLARSGTRVAQLSETFGMTEATIYNWINQERIDRGESQAEALGKHSSSRPRSAVSASSRPNWPSRGRSTRSSWTEMHKDSAGTYGAKRVSAELRYGRDITVGHKPGLVDRGPAERLARSRSPALHRRRAGLSLDD
jgi:transposase-like protein